MGIPAARLAELHLQGLSTDVSRRTAVRAVEKAQSAPSLTICRGKSRRPLCLCVGVADRAFQAGAPDALDLLNNLVELPHEETQPLLLLHALACALVLPAACAQLVGQACDRDLELEVCRLELHVFGSQRDEIVLDVSQLPSQVSVVPVHWKV